MKANQKLKNQRQNETGERSKRRGAPANHQWGTGHLVAATLIGVAIGWFVSGMFRPEPPSPPANLTRPAVTVPASTNQPAAPAPAPGSGVADSFGRSPGDEHYGHNHP